MLPYVIRWLAYGAVFHLWLQSSISNWYLLPWAIFGLVSWKIADNDASRIWDTKKLDAIFEEQKAATQRHFDQANREGE